MATQRVQLPISFEYLVGGNLQPVPNTSVTVIDRNTGNPATVYTALTGSTTWSNLQTDSGGNIPGYVVEGSYSFTVAPNTALSPAFNGATINWEAVRGDGVENIYPAAVGSSAIAAGAVQPSHLSAGVDAMLVPTGALLPYGGGSAPSGFHLCDGSVQSRSDPNFTNLFSAIGTTYNIGGETNTQFRLPNTVGRFLLGATPGSAPPPPSIGHALGITTTTSGTSVSLTTPSTLVPDFYDHDEVVIVFGAGPLETSIGWHTWHGGTNLNVNDSAGNSYRTAANTGSISSVVTGIWASNITHTLTANTSTITLNGEGTPTTMMVAAVQFYGLGHLAAQSTYGGRHHCGATSAISVLSGRWQAGDLAVMSIFSQTASIPTPNGWTLMETATAGGYTMGCYYQIVTTTGRQTIQTTLPANSNWALACAAYPLEAFDEGFGPYGGSFWHSHPMDMLDLATEIDFITVTAIVPGLYVPPHSHPLSNYGGVQLRLSADGNETLYAISGGLGPTFISESFEYSNAIGSRHLSSSSMGLQTSHGLLGTTDVSNGLYTTGGSAPGTIDSGQLPFGAALDEQLTYHVRHTPPWVGVNYIIKL